MRMPVVKLRGTSQLTIENRLRVIERYIRHPRKSPTKLLALSCLDDIRKLLRAEK